MIRHTIALVGIAGLAVVGCAGPSETVSAESVTFATDQGFEATVPAGSMDPCTYDDGTGAPCVYVADERGNGQGTSFVVLESYDGPMGRVTHDQARTLSK